MITAETLPGPITPETGFKPPTVEGKRENTCSGCSARWPSTAMQTACHCSGCHETFSGLGLFEAHRGAEGEHGHCIPPATLDACEHRDGMWRGPAMPPEVAAKFRAGRTTTEETTDAA
jgi:hypothetical protein